MPTLFETADRAVAGSAELQEFIRGERVALIPPGTTAFLAVNMLVLLCWLSIGVIVGMHVPRSDRAMLTLMIVAGLSPAFGIAAYRVVLGSGEAHRGMSRLTILLCILSVLSILSLMWERGIGHVEPFFWVGLASGTLAHRLVRSPSYALFAAFFRAKRAYQRDVDRRRRELLHR